MSNLQAVYDRLPSEAPNAFVRFNIIDNGDNTVSIYVEDRPNSDAFSTSAAILATGKKVVGGASGTVTGSGTTNAITKWTNGPGSVLGDSSLLDNATLVGFGGLTSAFPALKRSGSTLQVRLADDSAFAPFNSAAITVVAGNVALDNNQAIRIKDSGGSLTTALTISSGNNLTFNTPAIGGNILFQIPNAAGTAFFIFNSLTVLTISQTGVLGFADGVRQTFNPNATTPGINVGSQAGDPSTLSNGDLWYDSTGNLLRARINGATVSLGLSSGANTALSNLAAVAVNLALSPGADNSISLNDVTHRYVDAFLSGQVKWTDGAGVADAGLKRFGAGIVGITNGGAGVGAIGFNTAAIRQSAASASTLSAVSTGDLETPVNLAASVVKFISDDTTLALSSVSEMDNGVVQAGDGDGNRNGWFVDAGLSRVSAQFNKNNTTLANVTGLSLTLQAGRNYTFRAVLHMTADAIGGIKLAIGGTATATAIIYQINAIANTTNANVLNSRQTAIGGAAGVVTTAETVYFATIEGTITVNAAGTLTVQFAQNVANGTSSVLVGSSFIAKDNP